MKRKSGYYLVNRQGHWIPAFLRPERDDIFARGEVWSIMHEPGARGLCEDDIGPRIVMPDEENPNSDSARFGSHVAAVSRFLSNLYMILVDPLAEDPIPVEEMMKILTTAALLHREKANQHQILLSALRGVMGQIEGALIRETAADDNPGWAMRQIPLVRALKAADEAITMAEAHP